MVAVFLQPALTSSQACFSFSLLSSSKPANGVHCKLNNHEHLPKPHETIRRVNHTRPNDHSQVPTTKWFVSNRPPRQAFSVRMCVHICVQLGQLFIVMLFLRQQTVHVNCRYFHRDCRIAHVRVLAQGCAFEAHQLAAFCFTQNRTYRGRRTGLCIIL